MYHRHHLHCRKAVEDLKRDIIAIIIIIIIIIIILIIIIIPCTILWKKVIGADVVR
jgi:uncharacterized phage infection (PIP) family protein YhgE